MRRFLLGMVVLVAMATGIGVGLSTRVAVALNAPICLSKCEEGTEYLCCPVKRGTVCTATGQCGGGP